MKLPSIDITVEAGDWPVQEQLASLIGKAVSMAAKQESLDWVEGAELSLLFTDDKRMAAINGEWRGKPKATNVLSFPGEELQRGETAGVMIGDLVFARETIGREAAEQGKTFADHLTHLAIHGFLHLFGYDHETDEDASVMEAAETRILRALGIDDPYAYLDA